MRGVRGALAGAVIHTRRTPREVIIGSSRAFFAKLPLGQRHSWDGVRYEKLFLLGRSLSFTIDLSAVGCGCNAAVYLVALPAPGSDRSCYCDITYVSCGNPCVEVDLLEANVETVQVAIAGRKNGVSVHNRTRP